MCKTQYTLKKQFNKTQNIFSSPDLVAHNTDEEKNRMASKGESHFSVLPLLLSCARSRESKG